MMVEVMLDNERFVIDGGVFVEGPVARANEIKDAVKRSLAGSLGYVPDMDYHIGEFMEKELGGKITKLEPLPDEDGDEDEVIY